MSVENVQKEISIVIPVYNSHECVAEISRQIADAMGKNGISYEQIMVNDCSKDSSWDEIKKRGCKKSKSFGNKSSQKRRSRFCDFGGLELRKRKVCRDYGR